MDEQIINLFYSWDNLEKLNGKNIIEFDLLNQSHSHPNSFSNREEIKKKLQVLIENYNQQEKPDAFISAKLSAALYYLKALLGEKIPFNEYIKNIVGVTPVVIPENEIVKQLNKIKSLYKELGYQYTREDLKLFTEQNLLSKTEVESSFTDAKNNFVPKILEWLELDLVLDYQTMFVEVDDYWMNWTSTDDHGNFLLQFNLKHPWKKGIPESLALHEIGGHIIQASSWKDQIQRGKMPASSGLITIFAPESFICEGIAETLSLFYPENLLTDYGKLAAEREQFYWMVWNNAHLMVNQEVPLKQILSYLENYLPSSDGEEDRKKDLLKAKTDPLYRQYLYVYGISTYYHKKLADKLTAQQKKDYVLKIYQNILTPDELNQNFKSF